MESDQAAEPVVFQTHPDQYKHWTLTTDGQVARLEMDVDDDHPLRGGYELKLNSYDLAVDIELADAVQRLRFGHPEVKVVVVTSGDPDCFCAGANIYMLGASTHGFKVNFCKFTNETRLYLEDATAHSGQHYIAALNGVASGGGYELALACETIVLQDDGSSAVSFPETPLLAVLPGTGGLTRLVDKRMVRRDLADVFSTLAEGVRGQRAVDWGLVDGIAAKSKFGDDIASRCVAIADGIEDKSGPGVNLPSLSPTRGEEDGKEVIAYEYVSLSIDRAERTAELTMHAPKAATPTDADALREAGASVWGLHAFRELDRTLLDLRFNYPDIGLIVLKTAGDAERVKQHDEAVFALSESDWFAKEVVLGMVRVLKRLDLTARSFFATIEPGSCFVGSLLELAFAADRAYMLEGEDEDGGTASIGMSVMNHGALPMSNGLTRLQTRFLGKPDHPAALRERTGMLDSDDAVELGLVTFAFDDIDWEDDVRIAIEERASISPDALTGMEANLRFAGPETMETKIFARLSAWQNWIFQRPNAVGKRGALTMYGHPERPEFDWRRT
jgi:benzoyl-CoA-dihydrodiol lyase